MPLGSWHYVLIFEPNSLPIATAMVALTHAADGLYRDGASSIANLSNDIATAWYRRPFLYDQARQHSSILRTRVYFLWSVAAV